MFAGLFFSSIQIDLFLYSKWSLFVFTGSRTVLDIGFGKGEDLVHMSAGIFFSSIQIDLFWYSDRSFLLYKSFKGEGFEHMSAGLVCVVIHLFWYSNWSLLVFKLVFFGIQISVT